MNFDSVKLQIRDETNSAFQIWKDLLIEFHDDNLSYAYAKGSAIKKWDSKIDYVPVLSDVDIHYGVHDASKLFSSQNSREDTLKVSLEYEKRFLEENPDRLHIPRTQVMCISMLQTQVTIVPPLEESVHILYGEFPDYPTLDDNYIREIDRNSLNDIKEYLNKLPDSYLDKTGLDYWSSLRTLNWRVSPSPVRILTQLLPNPMNVWTWNRTNVKNALLRFNLSDIAETYEKYYLFGWDLFNAKLSGSENFVKCLLTGSNLLQLCYDWYFRNKPNNTNN